MANEDNVSTEDTPQPRNAISVVTEENAGDIPPDPSRAADPGEPNADASAVSTDDNPTEEGETKPKRRRNRSREREVRKAKREAAEAQAALEQTQAENLELSARLEAIEARLGAAAPAAEPKLDDYVGQKDAGKKFAADFAIWEESQKAPEPAPKKEAAPVAPPPDQADIDKLHTSGQAKFGDEFAEALSDTTLPLSREMVDFILDSDVGADLIMWVDGNRRKAGRIFDMDADGVVEALEALEKTIDTGPDKGGEIEVEPPKEDRTTSKAPPPPGEAPRGGEASGNRALSDGLPMDDYAAIRRREEKLAH